MKEKTESLNDLQRMAIAKHGEDYAYSLAYSGRFGKAGVKSTWRAILAEPERTPDQTLDHQLWQRQIQQKYFGRTF